MKADYVHKDTLTATNYVELQKENELIVSYNQQLLKENKELKKQIEEYKKDIKDLDNQNKSSFENMQLNQLEVCNMIKQQKEFIKWLEDEIEQNTPNAKWKHYNEDGFNDYDVENGYGVLMRPVYMTLKEILHKYKRIIGVSDENN